MDQSELKKILEELYRLEPDLRGQEAAIIKVISKMADWRPETGFDRAFAARLKAEILGQPAAAFSVPVSKNIKNSLLINFTLMNKKMLAAVGSLAVLGLAAFMLTNNLTPKSDGWILPLGQDESVSVLPDGAFGSLAGLTAGSGAGNASGAPLGLGAGPELATNSAGGGSGDLAVRTQADAGVSSSFAGTSLAAPMADSPKPASDIAVTSVSGVAPDAKMMILPYYSFKYSYVGEPLELSDTSGDVYRRLKGDGELARRFSGLIGGLSLPDLDIKSFRNLKFTNISLAEDRDQGLLLSLDFNEDNIYLSANWEKWRIPEREACAGDQACWDRFRLKPEDVPADAELVAMADEFLADHKISRAHYGEGRVVEDGNWRIMYAQATDQSQVYIPEYASVVYPLLINGEEAHDQSGSYAGLRVSINLLKKAADGLSNLSPYRYESSAYSLTTAVDAVIKAAESGGWNGNWYGGSENVQTIELGTPTRSYVQIWQYKDNRSQELFVPALIFPVLNPPANFYYGQRSVVVPLVQEMLDELNSRSVNGGGSSGQPMPLAEPTIMLKADEAAR